jgi:glycosyltransferase involved in cell wall biosynthesis
MEWYNTHVVPHPDFGIDHKATFVPDFDDLISLCFLGEFSLRKGADMLQKILQALEMARIPVKVSVHGIVASDAVEIQTRLRTRYGVEFKGQYDESFIVDELRGSNIHVLALLSAVEETYCYVLTKALNTGIAILHTGAGAIGERLEGYQRAFDMSKGKDLKTVLLQMKHHLQAREGIMTSRIPSSSIVQPNIWYLENYPLHKR